MVKMDKLEGEKFIAYTYCTQLMGRFELMEFYGSDYDDDIRM